MITGSVSPSTYRRGMSNRQIAKVPQPDEQRSAVGDFLYVAGGAALGGAGTVGIVAGAKAAIEQLTGSSGEGKHEKD